MSLPWMWYQDSSRRNVPDFLEPNLPPLLTLLDDIAHAAKETFFDFEDLFDRLGTVTGAPKGPHPNLDALYAASAALFHTMDELVNVSQDYFNLVRRTLDPTFPSAAPYPAFRYSPTADFTDSRHVSAQVQASIVELDQCWKHVESALWYRLGSELPTWALLRAEAFTSTFPFLRSSQCTQLRADLKHIVKHARWHLTNLRTLYESFEGAVDGIETVRMASPLRMLFQAHRGYLGNNSYLYRNAPKTLPS
ncbi:hypothetical protein C8R46DRAFT_1094182 [Mycena filopes]|nr:hypothetical protein C8R46DRAFT_1094182 [Mycena filopes]